MIRTDFNDSDDEDEVPQKPQEPQVFRKIEEEEKQAVLYDDEIPFEEEKEQEFVVSFHQMQHTSMITGNLQRFGMFLKEEDEVVQFTNNATKLCQSLDISFQPSEKPFLMNFINKYPHPRFINPTLAIIVSDQFFNKNKFEWDLLKAKRYNDSKPVFPKIRDYEEEASMLAKLKTNEEKVDLLKLNELKIQPHDILRYIQLFNMYQ
jgi:hypothetical protein